MNESFPITIGTVLAGFAIMGAIVTVGQFAITLGDRFWGSKKDTQSTACHFEHRSLDESSSRVEKQMDTLVASVTQMSNAITSLAQMHERVAADAQRRDNEMKRLVEELRSELSA